MPEFVLDTSGDVMIPRPDAAMDDFVCWDDLTPFEQGYFTAMLTESRKRLFHNPYDAYKARASGFRDLAPETLAMVRRDCERESLEPSASDPREEGGAFWRLRQCGAYSNKWAPLTPYLGDDGKVYLS
jgi:hypothetical protein